MSNIIDRRLNPKDKSSRNRQKFIQRSKEQIKKAVKESIDTGNIGEIENGKARVRVKGVSEPSFEHDSNRGNKKYILPGNKKYVVGDQEKKSGGGDGGGGRKGGLGRSEDDFEFVLNQDEYLSFLFEDLELPDLVKKQLKDVTKFKPKRSGYTNVGNPSQLDVLRSLKNSLGRRIGLRRPTDEEIERLQASYEKAEDIGLKQHLLEEIEALQRRQKIVPWIDPIDVRYRNFTPVPQPTTQAVMFCIMDVSGSMGQLEKDLSKRFFFLLSMFLRRKYEKVDVVFIRHHEEASEVDEDTFFNSRESGGTVVSSALLLTEEIIQKRYPLADWNVYVAQASDGDNYEEDVPETTAAAESLLHKVQYFAYVEIRSRVWSTGTTSVWGAYDKLSKTYENMHTRLVSEVKDVWKVFRDLFSREGTDA